MEEFDYRVVVIFGLVLSYTQSLKSSSLGFVSFNFFFAIALFLFCCCLCSMYNVRVHDDDDGSVGFFRRIVKYLVLFRRVRATYSDVFIEFRLFVCKH